MNNQELPLALKLYFFSQHRFDKLISFGLACLHGFWLGLLNNETLALADQHYFNTSQMYYDNTYNRRGFWNWERQVIEQHFQPGSHLLLIGVGGGREVLALQQAGYQVTGFECNAQLVAVANRLLQQENLPAGVQWHDRQQCPQTGRQFAGIIVGWGAYMLIQGRQNRIQFLQHLRSQLQDNAPILLSFYSRQGNKPYFQVIVTIGNTIRRLFNRNLLDLGDDLAPNYVHYFTRDEIAAELEAAGFDLGFYGTEGYGHAVGLAQSAVANDIEPALETAIT